MKLPIQQYPFCDEQQMLFSYIFHIFIYIFLINFFVYYIVFTNHTHFLPVLYIYAVKEEISFSTVTEMIVQFHFKDSGIGLMMTKKWAETSHLTNIIVLCMTELL